MPETMPPDPLEPYGCPSCRNEPCRCPDLDICSVEDLDAEINAIPIRMTKEDQLAFAEGCANPPPLAEPLKRAFERLSQLSKVGLDPEELIAVCDKCLMASCWQGIFMCDGSATAGTTRRTRRELISLGLEHPDYIHN